MLPSLDYFAVFARVAETGSFSRAARDLGLSKATVSKRVADLEEELGVALVSRTTRRVSLTEAGTRVLARAQRILEEAEAAREEASEARSAPSGRLKITAPSSFGVRYLAPVLPSFMAAYPDITLDIRLSDKVADVVGEGFDAAVRISEMTDSSLIGRRLAPVQVLAIAAPAYWEAHGRPDRPERLAEHRCFVYANMAAAMWRFEQGGERVQIRPPELFMFDSADVILPALRAGLGVALLPDFIVWEDVEAGRLEPGLKGWTLPELQLHILTPAGRGAPRKVRVFGDFLHERYGADRAPWVGPCAKARSG